MNEVLVHLGWQPTIVVVLLCVSHVIFFTFGNLYGQTKERQKHVVLPKLFWTKKFIPPVDSTEDIPITIIRSEN